MIVSVHSPRVSVIDPSMVNQGFIFYSYYIYLLTRSYMSTGLTFFIIKHSLLLKSHPVITNISCVIHLNYINSSSFLKRNLYQLDSIPPSH